MNYCSIVLAFALVVVGVARAQVSESESGLVALQQARLDAVTSGVVLNIAAHPDDESSRTNTMLRSRYGLHVVTAYSTYGEGGQNAIGKEHGDDLARLRVRETLRASAMMDVEVRWLGMRDFGYSKTLDETLAVWGKGALLSAMRKVVDEVDPDFVITNHDLTHGHGHHRASFWAITEVLQERARQGLHVPALYSRCSPEAAQLVFDPSDLDPIRGETYARIAHRAWTQHATQGPWGAHEPLQVGKDYWQLVLPEGASKSQAASPLLWVRPQFATLGGDLAAQMQGLSAEMPRAELANLARTLLLSLRRLRETKDVSVDARSLVFSRSVIVETERRMAALQRILCALANVRVEAWLDSDEVARGGEGKAYVVVHGMDRLTDLSVHCGNFAAEPVVPRVRTTLYDAMPVVATGAGSGNPRLSSGTVPAPAPAPALVPGRLAVKFENRNAGATGPEADFVQLEVQFVLDSVLMVVKPRLAFSVVDPVSIEWDRDVVMVPAGKSVECIFSSRVRSRRVAVLDAPIRLAMGPGIKAEAIPGRVALSPDHSEARVLVRAAIDARELGAEPSLRLEIADQQASLRIVPVEVFVPPGMRVCLVRGPDDTTERALADLGVTYVALDRDALATARLEDFTTLLLDIRAYNHRPELAEHRDRILQYCRSGGRVVVMYHKAGEWNERAGHPLLAPFPLAVGDLRATEEDAAVLLLQPEHRLWQYPHKIAAQDFVGWVQERGINFPVKWDPAWTALLELKDSSDEKPNQGAVLYTQYGRGDFVYCSLVLYRQLSQGNPGAARILLNLLAR